MAWLSTTAEVRANPPVLSGSSSAAASLPTQRFVADLRSKNRRDILRLYTPDAVFVDPSERLRGSAALRNLYVRIFSTYDSDLDLERRSLSAGAGAIRTVVDSGTYVENLRVRSTGRVQHLSGRYRFTYELQRGRWLFARQEWLP